MKLYQEIAALINAIENCTRTSNHEWDTKHYDKIMSIVRNEMPDGSGFDNGTYIDMEKSTGEKLVFETSFHHMNENGYYNDWTEHSVIVTPSLQFGFNLKITGRDRNQIKDYIYEVFSHCSEKELE